MLRILVISFCACNIVSSRGVKRLHYNDDDFFGSATNQFENAASFETAAAKAVATNTSPKGAPPPGNDSGKGYSTGSGLRSIAQGSADQASNAVMNQHAAANQAAYVAKNTLAQAAAGASATAQAALAGKQILLQGLEQQLRDAQVALDGELQQLQQAQRSATATQQASQQAQQHVNILTTALNAAQAAAEHANQAASEAAGELAAQQAMVGGAKERIRTLTEQLHGVRIDFEATQAAAQKAQAAAQLAQANAAEAAAAAAASFNALNHEVRGGSEGDGRHETSATSLQTDTYIPYEPFY